MTESHHKPLVVDWAQDERTDLEAELRQKQIVVVSYDCNELRIIPECRLEGDYGYTGVTKKETVQHFEGELEIGLNLPLNGLGIAAQLGAKTGRDAALDLALVTVGQRRSTRVTATRDDLTGRCEAATHFIRGVQVGAFAIGRAEHGRTEAAAVLFQANAGGHTSDAHKATISDGAVDSCNGDVEATSPPAQCGAPLRIELVAIEPGNGHKPDVASVGNEASRCPEGAVWTGEKCAPKGSGPYQCAPGAVAECETQCAAKQPGSCYELGRILEHGMGATKDLARAATLYQQACDAGIVASCNNLGGLYGRGEGVTRDDAKAIDLYKRACDQGDATACVNLGAMHFAGNGVPKNESLGTRLFYRGCEAGEPIGCLNVGVAYGEGQGVPKDATRSFTFASRACTGGVARGCALVALAKLTGDGTTKDVKAGLGQLDAVCTQGEPTACLSLATIYSKGMGSDVPADPLRLREYAKKACDSGAKSACDVDKLLGKVDSGDTTVAQANALFQSKCDSGSLVACGLLGENLVAGVGASVDRPRG